MHQLSLPLFILPFFTHSSSFCVRQAIFSATETTAAHLYGRSRSWSETMLTVRLRTSGANLCVVSFIQASSSQKLERPTNPGRFTSNASGRVRSNELWCKAIAAPKISGAGEGRTRPKTTNKSAEAQDEVSRKNRTKTYF